MGSFKQFKRWLIAGLCLVAAAVVAKAVDPKPEAPVVPNDYPQLRHVALEGQARYLVTDVADGDTLTVQALDADYAVATVRLLGIDAPESSHPEKPVEPFAKEAAEQLRGLALGEQVWLVANAKGEETDRYGRKLAFVYRYPDGLPINLEMVRRGWARALTTFPTNDQDAFVWYESRARTLERGLWADATKAPGSAVTPTREPTESNDSIAVYRTTSGQKYHRASCSSLKKSGTKISRKAAEQAGLEPCKRCNP